MSSRGRDKRDVFYRKAKEEGWRARSAYKLLQLDEEFHLFEGVTRAVDLCAAPGSWSQVLAASLGPAATIVSVDLQEIAPLPGIQILKADITEEQTLLDILRLFEGHSAQLVVCDGAPDVTGLHALDQYVQSELVLSAMQISVRMLQPGGVFVAKMFRGAYCTLLYSRLRIYFDRVSVAKPKSSRTSSLESFVVCEGFRPPAPGLEGILVPFVACGDLSGHDSDTSQPLAEDHEVRGPVQAPISPPYKEAIEIMKKSV